jgi:aminoglycoside 6'-N-acetyltransferase
MSEGRQPTLRGSGLLLRPVTAVDAARMTAILKEPEVSEWWGRTRWEEQRPQEAEVGFAIEVAGETAGYIQYLPEMNPDYLFASLDVFVSARFRGRGVGTEAMRTLMRYLFEELGLHRLTVDPAAANERAIRVYEKLGFRRVGVMRLYERAAEGPWHDGLLMELLDEEWSARAGDER